MKSAFWREALHSQGLARGQRPDLIEGLSDRENYHSAFRHSMPRPRGSSPSSHKSRNLLGDASTLLSAVAAGTPIVLSFNRGRCFEVTQAVARRRLSGANFDLRERPPARVAPVTGLELDRNRIDRKDSPLSFDQTLLICTASHRWVGE